MTDRTSPETETLWAAIRQRDANINAFFAALKTEEQYLLGHFNSDCGIMPGDVEGSFHRLRALLRTPTTPGLAPTPGLPDRDAIYRAIESNVRSEPDKHFIDRRWMVGINDAVDAILALACSDTSTDRALAPAKAERWPAKGDRMVFLNEHGYPEQRKRAAKVFEVGREYEVDACDVGDWSHSVRFVGVEGWHNGVMFKRVAVSSPDRTSK